MTLRAFNVIIAVWSSLNHLGSKSDYLGYQQLLGTVMCYPSLIINDKECSYDDAN